MHVLGCTVIVALSCMFTRPTPRSVDGCDAFPMCVDLEYRRADSHRMNESCVQIAGSRPALGTSTRRRWAECNRPPASAASARRDVIPIRLPARHERQPGRVARPGGTRRSWAPERARGDQSSALRSRSNGRSRPAAETLVRAGGGPRRADRNGQVVHRNTQHRNMRLRQSALGPNERILADGAPGVPNERVLADGATEQGLPNERILADGVPAIPNERILSVRCGAGAPPRRCR